MQGLLLLHVYPYLGASVRLLEDVCRSWRSWLVQLPSKYPEKRALSPDECEAIIHELRSHRLPWSHMSDVSTRRHDSVIHQTELYLRSTLLAYKAISESAFLF